MTLDIKDIYYEKNNDLGDYYFSNIQQDIDETIDMSTGWSFVCLDETINYYAENLRKKNTM
uniref:Uncharacterized protein n=1 Tax=Melanothamnus harveyi TaxID=397005 RepID=A0A1Z1MI13_MELHR|nr:hypothetical protein [Melanothamnus harveyi]ARW65455.1 hypothetical protein [Melanothamnus harveyi]